MGDSSPIEAKSIRVAQASEGQPSFPESQRGEEHREKIEAGHMKSLVYEMPVPSASLEYLYLPRGYMICQESFRTQLDGTQLRMHTNTDMRCTTEAVTVCVIAGSHCGYTYRRQWGIFDGIGCVQHSRTLRTAVSSSPPEKQVQ
ncbi:hypothetical protein TNCV_2173911 [Trichonephila clavipes]|nr:hypothetical protein TNCV_2173911 [Trichonephila clavipes]